MCLHTCPNIISSTLLLAVVLLTRVLLVLCYSSYHNKVECYYVQSDLSFITWFRSVVVITSALHAEGREFEPRRNLSNFFEFFKS